MDIVHQILKSFDPAIQVDRVERIGSGHINQTYKILGPTSFILQRINNQVFTKPEVVALNIQKASEHLARQFPDYLFIAPLSSATGTHMVYDASGVPWRLYPFMEHSYTIDKAESKEQAFKAAAEFGRLGKFLKDCDTKQFEATIPRFHDLSLRYNQFEEALRNASHDRKKRAAGAIAIAEKHSFLVHRYRKLIEKKVLVERIFHNDTKINNVLFDASGNTLAVIDLDTLMPGYFIYDLGDLLRTLSSPVSEEEKDTNKIVFRKDFYEAVVEGYLSEMKECLTEEEAQHVSFAGPMMTYIMALRFLADFLRGDTYYQTHYPEQNLVRSTNQLRLVELFLSNVPLN